MPGNLCPAPSVDWETAELASLLIRVGTGDLLAFKSIYDRTHKRLFLVCLRISRNHADAEDVLFDVYLNIWRKAHIWAPERGSPMVWLKLMARHRAIDRQRLTRSTIPLTSEIANVIRDETPDGIASLIETEERKIALDQISKLPSNTRDTINGLFFEDQSYVEMSQRTGESVSTIKSRVRRGLSHIRDKLKDE